MSLRIPLQLTSLHWGYSLYTHSTVNPDPDRSKPIYKTNWRLYSSISLITWRELGRGSSSQAPGDWDSTATVVLLTGLVIGRKDELPRENLSAIGMYYPQISGLQCPKTSSQSVDVGRTVHFFLNETTTWLRLQLFDYWQCSWSTIRLTPLRCNQGLHWLHN